MLYLIRHSTTVHNPDESSHTWVLSPEGRVQAQQLARRLAGEAGLTRIYTSTEAKASETAEIIASELGIAWDPFDGLHEQERYEVPYFSTRSGFEAAIARFFDRPDELVFGEETADQACARFIRAIDQIGQLHPAKKIAIVTHGTVISLFVSRHNPAIDVFGFWRKLTMPDCYACSQPDYQLQQRITVEPLEAE